MVEADDYEVGLAHDVLSGRHSVRPALIAICIGGALMAWMVFSMNDGSIGLGEKFTILGLTLLFWVIWIAFADAPICTAKGSVGRHPVACTLALLIFAYLAVPSVADAVASCLAAGSLAPAYGAIGIRFMFAPFLTEVALRLFLTVAEAAGKLSGSHKR